MNRVINREEGFVEDQEELFDNAIRLGRSEVYAPQPKQSLTGFIEECKNDATPAEGQTSTEKEELDIVGSLPQSTNKLAQSQKQMK